MATATIEQLIECLYSDQMQESETAALQLFLLYNLDALTGKPLERVAEIVGAPLATTVDADLRSIIRGVIAAKNADGDVESLLEVMRLILNQADATIAELYPAELLLFADVDPGSDLADICLQYMRQAVAGGVKIGGIIIVPTTVFRLDTSLMDGTHGLATIYS